MDSFKKYIHWLNGLSKEERDKFEFLQSIAVYRSTVRLGELVSQSNLRRRFLKFKFSDSKSFIMDELNNTLNDLVHIPLFIDWDELHKGLLRLQAIDKNSFDNPYGLVEEELYILFRDIIYFPPFGKSIKDKYYSLDIDVESIPAEFDTKELDDFDKVVDIMARFQLIVIVNDKIKDNETDSEIQNPARLLTFADLFRDKINAQKVKDIFETKRYTIKGIWQGQTNDKSELLCAYNVLKDLGLLKPGSKTTPTAKIFYSEFGLPDGYISDRMLRTIPKDNDITKEFERIFSHLNPNK